MLIQIENNLDKFAQNSYLSQSVVAGTNALPIVNVSNFQSGWAVQIGRTGEERSEIKVLTAGPLGSAALTTTAGITYDHPIDTPIYNVHYDYIIFKRSISGTTGTATAIADGTVAITPDSLYTEFNDPTGATSYAYRTQYYNSLTGDLSAESEWFTPGGPSFYSLQKIRTRIKNRIYDPGFIKTDDVLDEFINEWLEEMNTAAVKVNKDYLLGTTTVAFGTAGYGTITASDFMYPRKFEVTYDGVNYSNATKVNVNEYDESNLFTSATPRYSWHGDTLFRVLGNSTEGTARIIYSKGEAIMNDENDELPYPMRRYSRSFVEYGLYCAYGKDQKESSENSHYQVAQKIKNDFINEITPRDQTGVQHIQYVEPLSGDDSGDWDEYL